MQFTNKLQLNINSILNEFDNSSDIIVKQFLVQQIKCAVVYLKGMCDVLKLTDFVIKPMQNTNYLPKSNPFVHIINNVINFPEINEETNFNNVIGQITKGKVVLLFENCLVVYVIELDSPKERSLTEPPTSAVLKGPREGFNENLKTNIAVVRKIFSTSKLKNSKGESFENSFVKTVETTESTDNFESFFNRSSKVKTSPVLPPTTLSISFSKVKTALQALRSFANS